MVPPRETPRLSRGALLVSAAVALGPVETCKHMLWFAPPAPAYGGPPVGTLAVPAYGIPPAPPTATAPPDGGPRAPLDGGAPADAASPKRLP